MDIAAMSVQLAQFKAANQVGASVMNITKDVMIQQGQALEKLMASTAALERSVNPSVGSTIDIRL